MEKGSSEGHLPGTTPNDQAEAVIKLIGPGETCLRVANFCWRLAWAFIKRRPWLSAWLVVVIITSILPCLFWYGRLYGQSQVVWRIGGGGLSRIDMAPLQLFTPSRQKFAWDADVSQLLHFSFQWSFQGQPVNDPPFLVAIPVWAILAPPTLAFTTPILIRDFTRRRRVKRAVAAGRIPCPACGYDATGLETCPECGAAIEAVLPEQVPIS